MNYTVDTSFSDEKFWKLKNFVIMPDRKPIWQHGYHLTDELLSFLTDINGRYVIGPILAEHYLPNIVPIGAVISFFHQEDFTEFKLRFA